MFSLFSFVLAGLSLVSRCSCCLSLFSRSSLAVLSFFSRSSLSLFSLALLSLFSRSSLALLSLFSLALLQVAPGRAHAFGGVAGRKPHGTHVLFVFSGGPRQLCGRGRHVFGIFTDGAKRERCDGRRGSGQHGWHTSVAKKISGVATRHRHRKKKKREDRPFLNNQSKRRQVFPRFRTEDVIVPSTFNKDMYVLLPCHVMQYNK